MSGSGKLFVRSELKACLKAWAETSRSLAISWSCLAISASACFLSSSPVRFRLAIELMGVAEVEATADAYLKEDCHSKSASETRLIDKKVDTDSQSQSSTSSVEVIDYCHQS